MIDRSLIERANAHMRRCLQHNAAHDPQHIYRVLNVALDIARHEQAVDHSVLILACLLHDIGRPAQSQNPQLCHAEVGAQMALDFLLKEGLDPVHAQAVSSAILSHRSSNRHAPQSIEAKILYDADKIDVTGALGMARSLMYNGSVCVPLYHIDADGQLLDVAAPQGNCFLREYESKLNNLHEKLYTQRGREIAAARHSAAQQFYQALLDDIHAAHKAPWSALEDVN